MYFEKKKVRSICVTPTGQNGALDITAQGSRAVTQRLEMLEHGPARVQNILLHFTPTS